MFCIFVIRCKGVKTADEEEFDFWFDYNSDSYCSNY
jgi:hypothetical protein